MSWNFDIDAAPHGKMVKKSTVVGFEEDGTAKVREGEEFVPDILWLATKCGKVIKGSWKPSDKFGGDRFIGLNKGEKPKAWQHYVVPVHPDLMSDQ